jgi:hypothetical protein
MGDKSGQQASRKRRAADAVRQATAYGIDVSLIRDNLARTPAERMRRHEIALATAEMLRKARFLGTEASPK